MKRIVEVEPLGTRVILPALVLGYDVTGSKEAVARALPENTPNWIWLVAQQAGGLSMTYPVLLGIVLRLEANEDCGDDVAFLIRGLKAMAEDPDIALLQREYPILAELVNTWGEEYEAASLDKLNTFLKRFLRLPPIADGLEAFLRLGDGDLVDYFENWRMLQHEFSDDGPAAPYAFDDGITYVDESNLRHVPLREEETLSPRHLEILQSVGKATSQEAPSAFLIWENSD